MTKLLSNIRPTAAEVAAVLSGDDIVPDANVVMDRAFTIDAAPDAVWPWLVQLGKWRAGWYLPSGAERFIPRSRRAIRHLDPRWAVLQVGDVIPDYGGRRETFEVAAVNAPTELVYKSQRGQVRLTWSITLTAIRSDASDAVARTRVHLRLRLGSVRRKWLAETVGELFDAVTIAGLAAGMRERIR